MKDPIKRLALQKYYAKNPTAKELEPLKFSKINKFASKIEVNADIFGITVIATFQTFESDDRVEGMAHLNNIFDLTRNIKSEANLKRFSNNLE
jgi:hypothetical protein